MDDDMISRIFPNGLRILLVDDDGTFLGLLELMLSSCHYKVTACNSPISALSMLLEEPDKFDLLLTDLEMPEMNGYELLKIVNKRLRIPIILMSVDARIEVMMKGIQEGACYFLHKPISLSLVRNLWIHVVWKKLSDDKEMKRLRRESEKGKAPLVFDSPAPVDRDTSKVTRNDDHSNKGKMKQIQEEVEEDGGAAADDDDDDDEDDDDDDDDDPETTKKPRIVWTAELNQKFEDAIQELGIEQAIPSKIAQLMNVEGVDRHHVGSHLQKYRIRLRQEKERQQAILSWNQFHYAMNPSYQAEYMGMGPKNMSGSSSNQVLVPQTGLYPTMVDVPWNGNAILGSFSRGTQPQQVGGFALQYYNTNCFPNTATFGATDVGINFQNFSTNPAQNIRGEYTIPVTQFGSFNNNFPPPGTSTSGCHAAGGSAPSGILMDSNQALPINMDQQNLGGHEAGTSSRPVEVDDMDKFLQEFLSEDDW